LPVDEITELTGGDLGATGDAVEGPQADDRGGWQRLESGVERRGDVDYP
jgi:hypothetical protein